MSIVLGKEKHLLKLEFSAAMPEFQSETDRR